MRTRKTPRVSGRPSPKGGRLGPLSAEISRREFLAGLAAATGALALGGCSDGTGGGDPEFESLPAPESSGIEHVVVLMMENRSFDHFLGWLPGADGMQAGLEYVDRRGQAHATYHLDGEFQGCQYRDPDHSYRGGRIQLADGASDGWLLASTDDLFPIGYYLPDDLDFFRGAVPAWTTCDRYFCSILSSTYPNRVYQHAGQTDRLTNTFDISSLQTIWDRLAEKGLSHTYYYSDLPVTALWGSRLLGISKLYDEFLSDAAAGRLPAVSFVDPAFIGEGDGTSTDDHPFADIRDGQAFLNEVYEALTSSPNWENTVLVVNYDEWGGFYDHVAPPQGPLTELDPVIGNDGLLGFRVPSLVVSPLARRNFIARQPYDHTSILTMIEWRWGLDPLSVRDATANNLAHVLDFRRPKDLSVPRFSVPRGPFSKVCVAESLARRPEFAGLREMAVQSGFRVR
jgi:phospholipase C